MRPTEAADDNVEPFAVRISCHVATPLGLTCVGLCRIDGAVFARVVAEVIHSFRTMSDAKGMEMTEQEMRSNCWAPMLEKLADGAAMPVGPDFRDRALCFVAWAAFGDTVRNGDVVDILVAQNRDTTVVRRPRKWWRAGRRRLGRLAVATERQT